jgi:hypothetical protein
MEDINPNVIQEALKDFQRLQDELLSQSVTIKPIRRRRHYRFRETPLGTPLYDTPPPLPAVHYPPLHPISTPQSIQRQTQLHAYMSAHKGFPTTFTPDKVSFVIDTGASITITFDKNDFVTAIRPVQPTTLQGIASGLSVEGIGDAEYVFCMDNNKSVTILLRNCLYVPSCTIRLLCPRHLTENTAHHADGFNSLREHGILTCHGEPITVPYHDGTGLPIISTASGTEAFANFCCAYALPSTTNKPAGSVQTSCSPSHFKQNLTSSQ